MASQPDLAALSGGKKTKKPVFAAPQEAADPLADVAYSGDLEADSHAELDALQAGFRQRMRAEDDRYRQATDSEYWVALCFKTRADKERFLAAANLSPLGDKYLDGHRAARALGVDLD